MKKIAAFLFCWAINAAALEPSLLDQGYRQMYNLQFAQAHQTFTAYSLRNSADPMGPVSDAAAWLFSEFDRLHILQSEFWIEDQSLFDFHKLAADPVVKKRFEAALSKTQLLADAELRKSPDNANAQLASALRLGLRADYTALIEKRGLAALADVKQSRQIAEKLLAKHPDYYDAWIAVGLENYLLSLKPAPLRWFLHLGGAQTDKSTGLDRLRPTAEKGHYLLPYARLLLAIADLRDHAPLRAKEKLQWLAKEFPGNPLYR
ncbi:MAG: hypothetical protein ABUS49_12085, partial [Acidobacteriota bacterium]